MSRKKAERRKRYEERESSTPPFSSDSPVSNPPASPGELSDIRLDIDGMLIFLTGARDKTELCEMREKCRCFGRELNNSPGLPEKFIEISSRSFGTGEKCSSRSFCT
jgi:hypothetical protein